MDKNYYSKPNTQSDNFERDRFESQATLREKVEHHDKILRKKSREYFATLSPTVSETEQKEKLCPSSE